jgi:aryl-alcohol dehydrogenase-like predicted oxidoreductase
MKVVADLTVFAEARGHTLLELAFAWLLSHKAVPSIIAGVSSTAQVVSNVAASRWELTAAEIEEVDRLAPLPPIGS